jgi:hypothetical protein
VWFEDATGTTRSLERQFTEQVGFTLAGRPLSVSTGVFARYKSIADAETGGKARCSVTGRAWDASYVKTPLQIIVGSSTASQ